MKRNTTSYNSISFCLIVCDLAPGERKIIEALRFPETGGNSQTGNVAQDPIGFHESS